MILEEGSEPVVKLDIVIPAYNEEAAIEAIVRRCLDARGEIVEKTPVDEVTVTVVSDGSWDRTAEIAASFEPEIQLIAYEKNRGYGAAIKAGFAHRDGELVSFLDADGTCDPRFFVQLVNNLVEHDAAVSIGSRMTPQSKMPPIRRLGNRIWRALINWIAQTDITDAASGMRVMRRADLSLLEPLPDGLHYTPTMSCRAALDARLTIVEEPMDYEERVGPSKLSVVKDGVRFLKTILDVALTYQPFRLISLPGFFLLLVAAVLLLPPTVLYFQTGHVLESDIYRFMVALVFATGGFQMFLAGLAAERAVALVNKKGWPGGILLRFLLEWVTRRTLFVSMLVFGAGAMALVWAGLAEYATEGTVHQHWSRIVAGGFCLLLSFQCAAAAVLDRVLMLMAGAQVGTSHARVGPDRPQ